MGSTRTKVVDALAKCAVAEGRALAIARAAYPVGSSITWEKGRGIQRGCIEIVGWHHTPRFRVRNHQTDKVYWIDFYDVIRAAGEQASKEYIDKTSVSGKWA